METTLAKDQILNGGEFIVQTSNYETVFIPEDMDEEQQMIREMCHEFVTGEVQPKQDKIANQVSLLEQAGELGLLSAHIPTTYGGMEMNTNSVTLITEMLGGGGGSFSTSFAAHTGIGMLPILYFGTEAQKEKYLPRLSMGELKASYCLTEPSSGSDALAAKTRADLSEDGKHYILNGQKMWITNAGFADVFIVFAKIDGDKFTGFIVDKGAEGMTLGAEEDKLGIKGSSTRQVFFENTKVPVENLLGEIGKGHLIAFNVLNVGRFKLGAMCMGGNKVSLSRSIQYAKERKQFKTAIANFGAIQYKLAEIAIRNYVLESSVYRVSDLLGDMKTKFINDGLSFSDAMMKSAEEYAIECAIIKVYGSEVADYAADETVQIHGGLGFSEELAAARAYRDTRINRIYEGTNEINRMLSVNMILRKVKAGQLDLLTSVSAIQKELASPINSTIAEGTYGKEIQAVASFKKALLLVLGAAIKAQMDKKLNLRHEQMIVMNIADMIVDVFNAESTLFRLQKLSKTKSTADLSVEQAILQVYFQDANDRIAKNAKDALHSFISDDTLKVLLKGVKRFTNYDGINVSAARKKIALKLISE